MEQSGVDGRIILKRIFKKWVGGKDWITLAEDKYRVEVRVFMIVVINLWLS